MLHSAPKTNHITIQINNKIIIHSFSAATEEIVPHNEIFLAKMVLSAQTFTSVEKERLFLISLVMTPLA